MKDIDIMRKSEVKRYCRELAEENEKLKKKIDSMKCSCGKKAIHYRCGKCYMWDLVDLH